MVSDGYRNHRLCDYVVGRAVHRDCYRRGRQERLHRGCKCGVGCGCTARTVVCSSLLTSSSPPPTCSCRSNVSAPNQVSHRSVCRNNENYNFFLPITFTQDKKKFYHLAFGFIIILSSTATDWEQLLISPRWFYSLFYDKLYSNCKSDSFATAVCVDPVSRALIAEFVNIKGLIFKI